ncbi:CPBP family intramembrane glutamic endopeptidase [Streptomyces flavofungini]|uniref:CPBP family intramembrane glutamic endopeptidase n=1 Tax=Streptomyces flavofungini TaxID=68200 RepID=UPI0025B073F9|nr:type II CAAX endopeptidase family protein [Streptomyces flavofungini]WJV48598.1 type II CAAX endopeptidase family protein [Streptomyces flavofungini]
MRAPSGSLYHEQGRTPRVGKRTWWTEFLLVPGLIVAALLATTGIEIAIASVAEANPPAADSDDIFTNPLANVTALLIGLAACIPAVWFGVRWASHRLPGTLSSVTGGLRWGWLSRCSAVAFALMAVQLGLLLAWTWDTDTGATLERDFPGWPALLLSLAVLCAVVPFQAAAEEYVFRGWVVQLIGQLMRSRWPGIVLASLLFALAHGLGERSGFALLFYSALWWGWLVIRTGGLEAVIALHTANNVLSLVLAAAFGELADSSTAADAPWQALALELVFAPLYCLIAARLSDRHGMARQTP